MGDQKARGFTLDTVTVSKRNTGAISKTLTDKICATVKISRKLRPTRAPTRSPSRQPTLAPSRMPTRQPTQSTTRHPTRSPTRHPTRSLTRHPTRSPTRHPTTDPTQSPSTTRHTVAPTDDPWLKTAAMWKQVSANMREFQSKVDSHKKLLKVRLSFLAKARTAAKEWSKMKIKACSKHKLTLRHRKAHSKGKRQRKIKRKAVPRTSNVQMLGSSGKLRR